MSLISIDIRSPHSSDDEHFDVNRLKIAPISKVSNENIRTPKNQKVLIFMPLSRKKCPDGIYPPHGLHDHESYKRHDPISAQIPSIAA